VARRTKKEPAENVASRKSGKKFALTYTDEDLYRRLAERILHVLIAVAPSESRANVDVLQTEISNLLRETAIDTENVVSMRLTGRVIPPTKDAVEVKVREMLEDSFRAVSVEMLDKTLGLFGPDIRRGQKVLSSAKKGHEALYGTSETKRGTWAKYQQTCDDLWARHPEWSRSSVFQHAAKIHNVSCRTIRNRVTLKK
jgi:hypothetical protein